MEKSTSRGGSSTCKGPEAGMHAVLRGSACSSMWQGAARSSKEVQDQIGQGLHLRCDVKLWKGFK